MRVFLLFYGIWIRRGCELVVTTQKQVQSGSQKLLSGKTPIGELVKSTDYPSLDIIPADFSFRQMDLDLAKAGDKKISWLNC